MAVEIERKFLINNDTWRKHVSAKRYIKQAYLNSHKERTVRVRIADDKAFLTIKGKSLGISRVEFEYAIPLQDAQQLMLLSETVAIEKYRYCIQQGKHVWEVDEFLGENQGLLLAEIELGSEAETFAKPDWLGAEVSNDKRYFNSYLSQHPFISWAD